jgi:hypothetical protein
MKASPLRSWLALVSSVLVLACSGESEQPGATTGSGGASTISTTASDATSTQSTGGGASVGGSGLGGAGGGGGSATLPSDAEIEAAIEQATVGLLYISESDAPFELVIGSVDLGGAITEGLVREEFASYVEADPGADKPLSDLFGMERPWSDWVAAMHNCSDPNDPLLVELCEKMRALEGVLSSNLDGLTTFYFGSVGAPGAVDGIGVSIFLVGRTPSGKLVGVRTLAIWT